MLFLYGAKSSEHYTVSAGSISSIWFILRADSLYQEIPNSPTRRELRDYARTEFERQRNVSDLVGLSWLEP